MLLRWWKITIKTVYFTTHPLFVRLEVGGYLAKKHLGQSEQIPLNVNQYLTIPSDPSHVCFRWALPTNVLNLNINHSFRREEPLHFFKKLKLVHLLLFCFLDLSRLEWIFTDVWYMICCQSGRAVVKSFQCRAQIHKCTPLKNTHTHLLLLKGLSWKRVVECQSCKYQWERPSDTATSQGLLFHFQEAHRLLRSHLNKITSRHSWEWMRRHAPSDSSLRRQAAVSC